MLDRRPTKERHKDAFGLAHIEVEKRFERLRRSARCARDCMRDRVEEDCLAEDGDVPDMRMQEPPEPRQCRGQRERAGWLRA